MSLSLRVVLRRSVAVSVFVSFEFEVLRKLQIQIRSRERARATSAVSPPLHHTLYTPPRPRALTSIWCNRTSLNHTAPPPATTTTTAIMVGQDMPPTGGYEPVQYRRNLPVRGFRPAYLLVGLAGVMSWGFYRLGQGIREQKWVDQSTLLRQQDDEVLNCGHSELAREKMWSRIHLIPLLQAEEDRDVVRRDFAQKALEKELLGKEVPIYNKDRYVLVSKAWSMRGANVRDRFVRPTYAITPSNVTK